MALIDKKGVIRGAAGDMVFRGRGLKTVMQARPVYVNQTEATKQRSSEFGLASTTAKVLRLALKPAYDTYDGGMINRLVNRVGAAINACRTKEINHRDLHDGDLSILSGFQFNIKSDVDKVLKVRPQLTLNEDGTALFSLPPVNGHLDILYPRSTDLAQCNLKVSLFAFNLRDEYYVQVESRNTDLKRDNNDAISWTFSPMIPQDCILITCLSLTYFIDSVLTGRKNLNSKDFSPAQILAAFHYPAGCTDEEALSTIIKDSLSGYLGNEKLRNVNRQEL